MSTVTLPDGSTLDMEDGATVEDAAFEIGPGLGRDTVAGVVDGELVDKHAPLYEDIALEIVTDQSDEYVDVLRHSAAHVFAQALQREFPEAKLTLGPWTDDGFYDDVTGVDLDEDDLEAVEAEAQNVVEEDLPPSASCSTARRPSTGTRTTSTNRRSWRPRPPARTRSPSTNRVSSTTSVRAPTWSRLAKSAASALPRNLCILLAW